MAEKSASDNMTYIDWWYEAKGTKRLLYTTYFSGDQKQNVHTGRYYAFLSFALGFRFSFTKL